MLRVECVFLPTCRYRFDSLHPLAALSSENLPDMAFRNHAERFQSREVCREVAAEICFAQPACEENLTTIGIAALRRAQTFLHTGVFEITDIQAQQLRDINVKRRHLVEAQRPAPLRHERSRGKIVGDEPSQLPAPQSTGAANGPSTTMQRAGVRPAGHDRFV